MRRLLQHTATTAGIRVSVVPCYERSFSNERARQFVYAYYVTIENQSHRAVQLLSRHWYVLDPWVGLREVIGDGVVGEQPIIEPGASFEYNSSCQLGGDLGAMWGSYTMQFYPGGAQFEIEIPRFQMEVPVLAN